MDQHYLNDNRVTVTDKFIRVDHTIYATRNVSSVQQWGRPKSSLPIPLAIFCAVMSALLAYSSLFAGAWILACVAAAAGLYYYFSRSLFFVKVTGGGGDHTVLCSANAEYVHTIYSQIMSAIQAE